VSPFLLALFPLPSDGSGRGGAHRSLIPSPDCSPFLLGELSVDSTWEQRHLITYEVVQDQQPHWRRGVSPGRPAGRAEELTWRGIDPFGEPGALLDVVLRGHPGGARPASASGALDLLARDDLPASGYRGRGQRHAAVDVREALGPADPPFTHRRSWLTTYSQE